MCAWWPGQPIELLRHVVQGLVDNVANRAQRMANRHALLRRHVTEHRVGLSVVSTHGADSSTGSIKCRSLCGLQQLLGQRIGGTKLTMRRFAVVGALIVIGALFVARRSMLAPLEHQAALSKSALRMPVDVGSARTITWDIPKDKWQFEQGEAKLSLLVNRGPGQPCDVKGKSPLKLLVAASGMPDSGQQYDRLIRNWYYTTNEPLGPKAQLWEFYGRKEAEYGLGGVAIYPFEKLKVSVDVQVPDASLTACSPRLQLVPSVDYAVAEHLPFLRVARDVALGLCALVVIALAWFASGNGKRGA